MKQIQGLPVGWVWVNQAGDGYKGRHAKHLLTGETMSVRAAQTRQHGGTQFEQRVPKAQRKLYTPKKHKDVRFAGKIWKVYTSSDLDALARVMKKYHPQGNGYITAFGRIQKNVTSDRVRGKRTWAALSSTFDFSAFTMPRLQNQLLVKSQQFVSPPSKYALWVATEE